MTSPSRPESSRIVAVAVVAGAILVAFTAYSLWVIHGHGYTGFLELAGREPWALQMLLDLVLALVVAVGWLRGDARKRGIAAWPYIVVAVFFGSVGLLLYLVRRALPTRRLET